MRWKQVPRAAQHRRRKTTARPLRRRSGSSDASFPALTILSDSGGGTELRKRVSWEGELSNSLISLFDEPASYVN